METITILNTDDTLSRVQLTDIIQYKEFNDTTLAKTVINGVTYYTFVKDNDLTNNIWFSQNDKRQRIS